MMTIDAALWWDLIPALGGAIIGALAGGFASWLLAKRATDEVLARDKQQRIDTEKAAAFRVFVKLIAITNSVYSLRNHVRAGLAIRANPERRHRELWQVVIPMVGFSNEASIHFEPEELAVFYAAKEPQFLMDIMLLGQRHAASISSFLAYCERRDALRAVSPAPQHIDGEIGGADLTREQIMRLAPYTIPLNMLIEGLGRGLEDDWELARAVARKFGPIVQRYFDDPKFVGLVVPEDAAETEPVPTL